MFAVFPILAILWLPGISWFLFFGFRKGMSLLEMIVLSPAISFSLLSLILAWLSLLNVSSTTWVIPFILIIFSVTLLLLIGRFRITGKIPIISKADLVPILLFLLHSALWLLYFWKYPIFPSSQSPDPVVHATLVQTIAEGGGADLLHSRNYPIGLHFVLSLIIKNVPDELLVTLRQLIALLESMTILQVYVVSARLFTKKTAILASLTYAIVVPLGITHFTGPGTYANILADFLTLGIIYFLCQILESKSLKDYLTLVVLGGGMLLSHSTSMIFLVFVWLFSVVILLLYRKNFGVYLNAVLMLTLVPMLGIMAFPDIPGRALSLLTSSLRSPTSLLVTCEVWFRNMEFFLGLPGLLAITSTLVLYCWKIDWDSKISSSKGALWISFLFSWFLYASTLSIQGRNVWRLVLHSLVPGLLIIAIGLSGPIWAGCERLSKIVRDSSIQRVLKSTLFLCVLIGILAGGPATFLFNEFLGPGQRERQIGIYESMCWARDNTTCDALFVSMKLPEYRYLPIVARRTLKENYELPVERIYELLPSLNIQYVAISTSELKEATIPRGLSMAFRNEYVTILKIDSTLNRQAFSFT